MTLASVLTVIDENVTVYITNVYDNMIDHYDGSHISKKYENKEVLKITTLNNDIEIRVDVG